MKIKTIITSACMMALVFMLYLTFDGLSRTCEYIDKHDVFHRENCLEITKYIDK